MKEGVRATAISDVTKVFLEGFGEDSGVGAVGACFVEVGDVDSIFFGVKMWRFCRKMEKQRGSWERGGGI